jgi:protein TonB
MILAQEAPVSKSDHVHEDPDVAPMFTGGTAAMNNFISSMLSYPEEARERDAQGLVVYTFVVEKDGTLPVSI